MNTTFQWFKKFFLNYMWVGVAILLIAILLDKSYPESTRSFTLGVVFKLLEGIGISILIASIFTFASSTSEFINSTRNLLEDIIIKRNFLANIDPEGKKVALKSLIQPSSSEMNKYPNIGDYYGYFIDKTLEIKERNVRSNYAINVRAYICPTHNKIAIQGSYSYRLYPSEKGFQPITLGFSDSISTCTVVNVSDPQGERLIHKNPKLAPSTEGGVETYLAKIPLEKNFSEGKNHLDVELHVIEYGNSHWQLLQFKALQPTDGFRFQLHCEEEITVKEHAIFVVGAKSHLEISDNKKTLNFTCNQWVNEGSGLSVLVSAPEKSFEPKNPSNLENKKLTIVT
jgi:hypothetical protein